jgi:glycosyltransferase involved in cell wall biosynthesis
MNKPLVSVVIPAYNAAPYLEDAVKSLQAQTYKNLHIIIVNDGSKDDTAKVADRLARQDKRIFWMPMMPTCLKKSPSKWSSWKRIPNLL